MQQTLALTITFLNCWTKRFDISFVGRTFEIFKKYMTLTLEERDGSVVECLAQDRGLRVQTSLEALRCVHEQDTLSTALIIELVQPRKTPPDMTEKMFTGT